MRNALLGLLSAGPRQIHLVGIGGVGMAGLAFLLHQKGHRVTGSEQLANSLTDWLQQHGVTVYFEHAAEHVHDQIDLVIRTTAAPLDNPECKQAAEQGIPLVRRGEAFPVLLEAHRVIAVTGTHGKTTTTAMIAHLLRASGIDAGHFVGGESDQLGGVARLGEIMVVEADESDGTLVHYHPELLLVTNIEFDHMEHFADEQEMLEVFKRAIRQAKQTIFCQEDLQLAALCRTNAQAVGYGGVSDYQGEAFSCSFNHAGQTHHLGVSGQHNAMNAVGAFTVARRFGITEPDLSSFRSVDRRYELIGENEEVTIISDYAHHPTEIRAVLEVARALPRKRRIVIYQPHRYTRTHMLMDQFPPAFELADVLILAPVYAASEAPMEGGTSADLAKKIPGCLLADSLSDAWRIAQQELKPNDALLILGAGDVVQIADWAKAGLV